MGKGGEKEGGAIITLFKIKGLEGDGGGGGGGGGVEQGREQEEEEEEEEEREDVGRAR